MLKIKPPKLIHNIAALGSVHAAGVLVPLITLPYVTRTLGVEAWGQVALVQIVVGYFGLLTNWGFAWSATRKISAMRDDLTQLSSIFIATWAAQWFLALMASLLLLLCIAFIPFFQKDTLFYLYGIGHIISGVLFPAWFLNGLERMKAVAVIQIISRIATVPCIFLLIDSHRDAPLMIAIGAASGLLSGVITIYWIKKNIVLGWRRPTYFQIWQELKGGSVIFASTVGVSLYTTITPMILGVIAGPAAVGYYNLADRARQAAQSVLGPVSQALFPRMSHLFAHDPVEAKRLFKQTGLGIAVLSGTISLLLWAGAEQIVSLLAGKNFMPATVILEWLAPLPFIVGISNLFGVQVLLPNNKNFAFNMILGIAAAFSLCTIYPIIIWKGAEGAAINTFSIELFVTTLMGIYLVKKGFFFI